MRNADRVEPDQCPICLDTIPKTHCTTECKHNFCYMCLYSWTLKGGKTCPICRNILSDKDLSPDAISVMESLKDTSVIWQYKDEKNWFLLSERISNSVEIEYQKFLSEDRKNRNLFIRFFIPSDIVVLASEGWKLCFGKMTAELPKKVLLRRNIGVISKNNCNGIEGMIFKQIYL